MSVPHLPQLLLTRSYTKASPCSSSDSGCSYRGDRAQVSEVPATVEFHFFMSLDV